MHAFDPAAASATITGLDRRSVWHDPARQSVFDTSDPIVVAEGKGLRVRDVGGREYLDAVSGGLGAVNVGYGRESIANAVGAQLQKLCYFAGVPGPVPGGLFADKLLRKMPGKIGRAHV